MNVFWKLIWFFLHWKFRVVDWLEAFIYWDFCLCFIFILVNMKDFRSLIILITYQLKYLFSLLAFLMLFTILKWKCSLFCLSLCSCVSLTIFVPTVSNFKFILPLLDCWHLLVLQVQGKRYKCVPPCICLQNSFFKILLP